MLKSPGNFFRRTWRREDKEGSFIASCRNNTSSYGADHPKTAKILCLLSACVAQLGERSLGLCMMIECRDIFYKHYGQKINHTNTLDL